MADGAVSLVVASQRPAWHAVPEQPSPYRHEPQTGNRIGSGRAAAGIAPVLIAGKRCHAAAGAHDDGK
jgi:hypothetical protein